MTFAASDGVELVGWWIPAARAPASVRGSLRQQWGKNTVLVCHGLAANKSNQLVMARQLVPGGFNVLAFDFRAHGESGGQLTTFGKLEVNDVLGAVRWVRENHADQAHKIFGVGASMGGSALIVAAADDSDQGRAIEAVGNVRGVRQP
jgi:alpha-beta hydrolase superfamily lysophospholipase